MFQKKVHSLTLLFFAVIFTVACPLHVLGGGNTYPGAIGDSLSPLQPNTLFTCNPLNGLPKPKAKKAAPVSPYSLSGQNSQSPILSPKTSVKKSSLNPNAPAWSPASHYTVEELQSTLHQLKQKTLSAQKCDSESVQWAKAFVHNYLKQQQQLLDQNLEQCVKAKFLQVIDSLSKEELAKTSLDELYRMIMGPDIQPTISFPPNTTPELMHIFNAQYAQEQQQIDGRLKMTVSNILEQYLKIQEQQQLAIQQETQRAVKINHFRKDRNSSTRSTMY